MSLTADWRIRALFLTTPFVISAALLLCGGEFAVRYHERHRTSVPGSMPTLYYRQGQLGHALVRNFDYFGWVHTDAQGFRGQRPVNLQKGNDTFRIMAVGASTTFDSYVTGDSAAWPARLEQTLSRMAPTKRIEVINAGVPGYNIDQNLIRLESELFAFQPDLLLLYQDDLSSGLRAALQAPAEADDRRPHAVESVAPWTAWLEAHSLLYGKMKERFLAIPALRRPKNRVSGTVMPSRIVDPAAQQATRGIRSYLAVARTLGIPVVMPEIVQVSGTATHEADATRIAEWRGTVPFLPADSVLAGYARLNAVLRQIADSAQVPFIPMVDLGIAGTNDYAADDPLHFSDQGAARFADGLARRLTERHLVPTSAGQVAALLGREGASRGTTPK